jgi:hypothetical protein
MADGRCAGVDWAKDTHDVVVQGPDGAEVWAGAVPHSEAGLGRLTSS